MKVGVFQCAGGGLTPEQRLAKLANAVKASAVKASAVKASAVKANELDLIICPELFLSGYNVGEELRAVAQSLHGDLVQQVKHIAMDSGTAIVFGYPELAGTVIYNSAACFSGQGELLANHRKLMIPPGFEGQYFERGDCVTLFDLGGLRCGILVCFDAEFPEAVRATARAGAQLVIVPTALGDKWPVVANKVMPARAFENGVWLVYANHAGVENDAQYLGSSCIVAPDGNDAARAGSGEQVIACNVDIERVIRAQERLPFLPFSQELAGRF